MTHVSQFKTLKISSGFLSKFFSLLIAFSILFPSRLLALGFNDRARWILILLSFMGLSFIGAHSRRGKIITLSFFAILLLLIIFVPIR